MRFTRSDYQQRDSRVTGTRSWTDDVARSESAFTCAFDEERIVALSRQLAAEWQGNVGRSAVIHECGINVSLPPTACCAADEVDRLFSDMTSLWDEGGQNYVTALTVQDWVVDVLPRQLTVSADSFDNFVSDLASAALSGPAIRLIDVSGDRSSYWKNWITYFTEIGASNVGSWPNDFGSRGRGVGRKDILRQFQRWARRANVSLSRKAAVKMLFGVLCTTLSGTFVVGPRVGRHYCLCSARSRVLDFDFRVGNPPPVVPHALEGRTAMNPTHVGINSEADHGKVRRFKNRAPLRYGIRPWRADSREPPRTVALQSPARRERAA